MQASPPAGNADEAQRQAAIQEAVNLSPSGIAGGQLTLHRREDLETDLSQIAGSAGGRVFFYDVQSPTPAAASDDFLWALAPAGAESYRLYSFDASQGSETVAQEFDGLMSRLGLSIADEQSSNMGRFFMKCCVRGGPNELIPDEDSLRHAVERYFLAVFGDTPRMLEASLRWWKAYQASTAHLLLPAGEGGKDRIAIRRILLVFGAEPQLQEWELRVSRDGQVHVLAQGPIFPKGGHWLFYDFQSTLKAPGFLPAPAHFFP